MLLDHSIVVRDLDVVRFLSTWVLLMIAECLIHEFVGERLV